MTRSNGRKRAGYSGYSVRVFGRGRGGVWLRMGLVA